MRKIYVDVKESDGKRFFFVDFGSEAHGRRSFRLWISSSFVKEDKEGYFVEFPVKGCEIFSGKNEGTYILKKGDYNLFNFFVPSGYRGGSNFMVKESTRLYCFDIYESPQGSLGVSAGALILTPETRLTVKWERSGRLYGDPPEGTTLLYLDGREEEGIEDIKELE